MWERDHPVLAAAWTTGWSGLRPLSEPEQRRVLDWGGPDTPAPGPTSAPDPTPPAGPVDRGDLLVPWRTVVVLLETPPAPACERLAALAQYSGNTVVAVGYDCVPIVSADLVPAVDTQRFARYLSVVKHARRIAGISPTATTEFQGFGSALLAQGLPGPTIIECPLPTQAATIPAGPAVGPAGPAAGPAGPAASPADPAAGPTTHPDPATTGPAGPLVLSVGSLEPRKNHLALLHAAEQLWRDHLHFELLLIAGSGWGDEIPDRITHLQHQGRPLTVRTNVTDTELAAAYRQARFSVFASLHEGYGLPVAESLAYGTPVITTNYGSTRDIAAAGGALLIDPRDDHALTAAMRTLLTDDHQLHTLRHQLHTRPTRTWEHYAHDLWYTLVQPELPHPPPASES
jgi:glycosyltransferase involved in cell wall biosynthesis